MCFAAALFLPTVMIRNLNILSYVSGLGVLSSVRAEALHFPRPLPFPAPFRPARSARPPQRRPQPRHLRRSPAVGRSGPRAALGGVQFVVGGGRPPSRARRPAGAAQVRTAPQVLLLVGVVWTGLDPEHMPPSPTFCDPDSGCTGRPAPPASPPPPSRP